MKKQNLLSLLLFVMVAFNYAGAATVTATSAQAVATNFFKAKAPGATFTASLAYTRTESDGTTDYYIFNMSPVPGFVIVAADDNAQPVLAYSTESTFAVDARGITGVSNWMNSAAVKVHYVVSNNVQADANISYLWSSYRAGINPAPARAGTLGPLLTTTWNQNPYYNSLCPPAALPSTSNSKAVTGCVATAMAQIMKYWAYPAAGTGGTISYDDNGSVNYGTLSTDLNRPLHWSAMPNAVNSNTSAVDSLMYELGVAVNMDYDSTGSGAYVQTSEAPQIGFPTSQSVYPTNFYYNPATIQGVYLSSYSDADWVTLMEGELTAGRVVQYEGQDPAVGGHTWVMDGYQAQGAGQLDYLHMNWGWGGQSNGFFSVTNLATPGFNPSNRDGALIGIEPMFPFTPTASASPSTICTGSSGTQLSVNGPVGATYAWTPTTGLSCTTCATPTATPNTTTIYTCRVDSAGTIVPVTVTVTVATGVVPAFSTATTTSCSIPATFTFSNTSQYATSYIWEFGDGSTDTTVSPSHTYNSYGDFTVVLTATGSCGTDSLAHANYINLTDNAPAVSPQSVCPGQTATLTATSGTNIAWYTSSAGGTPVSTGTTYTTPSLSATTTYYVQNTIPGSVSNFGPANDAIGTGATFNNTNSHGNQFNCTVAQTLVSVDVVASSAGTRIFFLTDANHNPLPGSNPVAVNVPNGSSTVTLNLPLPVGTGMFLWDSVSTGNINLYRNRTGATYPYNSPDGTVSITGTDLGTGGNYGVYYYFNYNWKLQGAGCISSLVPIQVSVLTGSGGSFTYATTGNTVNFTAVTTGATYTWNFGDGSPTSTSASPSHIYADAGTYTVTEVVSNGGCQETISNTVTIFPAGIIDINAMENMTVYPNPVQDQLTIRVSTPQNDNCQMAIYNVLGEAITSKAVTLTGGTNTFRQDVSALAPGLYMISLQDGQSKATRSFVKQ